MSKLSKHNLAKQSLDLVANGARWVGGYGTRRSYWPGGSDLSQGKERARRDALLASYKDDLSAFYPVKPARSERSCSCR